MKRIFLPLLWLVIVGSGLQAQSDQSLRKLPREAAISNSPSSQNLQSIRIEEGKVWINGNFARPSDLPASLHNVSPNFRFQATLFGINDLKFNLMGTNYLLRNGRIVEIDNLPREIATPTAVEAGYDQQTKEAYYSNLKQEAPNIFYNLNREAYLYEKCWTLVLDYSVADPETQAQIIEEIRKLLGQLFDINIHNMEQEIKEVETQIQAAKEDIGYRKDNKSLIIDNRLEELLGN